MDSIYPDKMNKDLIFNDNEDNKSNSSLEFTSDSANDNSSDIVNVIIWENGKTAKFAYKIEITSTINTPKRLKETIIYTKNLSKFYLDKMIIYNHRGIEADDIDISNLKNDEILYCDLEGKEFSVKNYENEYEFLSFIKEGGFAQVYLAKHVLRGNLVAIKKTQIAKLDSESLYSISREALYLSTLRHKNIIKIYSSYLTDNALFIVMEYAKGGELFTKLDHPLTEEEAKVLFKQIHKAVKFCHSNNVIHRDLKPNNILFLDEAKTRLVLIDFGISGLSNGNNKETTKAGTYKFLPPEIVQHINYQATVKIDVWALGVILYLMVVGKCPFDGKTRKEIYEKISNEPLLFPKDIKISKSLFDLLHSLLKKNPKERIESNSLMFDKWYKDEGKEFADIEKEERDIMKKKLRLRERTITLKDDSLKYFKSKLSLGVNTVKSTITARNSKRQSTLQIPNPNYLKTTIAARNRSNRNSLFIK